jgi:type II secretion system protein C
VRRWLALLLVTPGALAQEAAQDAWRVAGTVVEDRAPAWALVENNAGEQRRLQVGDRLDGCAVRSIAPRGVAEDCAGQLHWRNLQADPKAVPVAQPSEPDTVELPAQAFRDLIKDRQRLVSEIPLKPRVRDGRVDGYEIGPLKNGSLFENRGLNTGDVIVAVDGTAVAQPQALMNAIRGLENVSDFQLDIERNGVARQLLVQLR